MNTTPKLMFTVNEACAALGIGRTSIYRLISEKRIELRKVAGRSLIPASSLHRLIDEADAA